MNITDRLFALIEKELGPKQPLSLETKLDDLGIDSLDFVSLLQAIEQEFGVKIPDEAFAEIETIGYIEKFLK